MTIMKRGIVSTAVMLLFGAIVYGQTSGSKSSENLYTVGSSSINNDLYENFETWPPVGWTFSSNNWSHGETGAVFFLWDWTVGGITTPLGGGRFVALTSGHYPDLTSWMISPSLVIKKGDILSFWVNSMPASQYLEILVSQSNNSTSSFTDLIGSYSISDQWIKHKLDLSKYEGKTIYIAWKITLQDQGAYSMIDMVRVGQELTTDAALLLAQPPDYVPAGELDITGTILNQGSGTITQADVSWQVDDGPEHIERFQDFSIAEDNGYHFVCNEKYSTSPGNHSLIVKILQVNGLGSDENPSNDSIKSFFYACSNSAPKIRLFEVFTNSSCGSCVGLNKNVVEPSTQKYTGKVAVVKYQMNFPGSGDYYISDNGIRGGYYGIGWVPAFYVDGITSKWLLDSTPADESLEYIDDLFMSSNEKLAVVEIKSRHTVYQLTKNIDLNATITPYLSGTGYRAFICVVEKVTTGNIGSNGETAFYSVLMKMLPDAQGISMNFVEGIPINIDISASLVGTYIEEFSDLTVVLFIQDINTKKVIQAAYSEDATMEASSLPVNDIRVYPNPSNGIINISGVCGSHLEICDILGRALFTIIRANCMEKIDLTGFKKGMYLLKITEGEKTSFHKVLMY
jgi:hypothetical protein